MAFTQVGWVGCMTEYGLTQAGVKRSGGLTRVGMSVAYANPTPSHTCSRQPALGHGNLSNLRDHHYTMP